MLENQYSKTIVHMMSILMNIYIRQTVHTSIMNAIMDGGSDIN